MRAGSMHASGVAHTCVAGNTYATPSHTAVDYKKQCQNGTYSMFASKLISVMRRILEHEASRGICHVTTFHHMAFEA